MSTLSLVGLGKMVTKSCVSSTEVLPKWRVNYDKTKSHYLEEGRGDFIDKRSGKLLGNKIMAVNKEQPGMSSCPLLSRKLRNLDECLKTENKTSEVDDIERLFSHNVANFHGMGI